MDSIQQLTSSIDYSEPTCTLLTGDFNFPAIDCLWILQAQPVPEVIWKTSFSELVGDYYPLQLISGPTLRDGNKLDLLLCNYPEIIRTSPDLHGYPTNHHILEFTIQEIFFRSQPIKRTFLDNNRGNLEQLQNALATTAFKDIPSENIDGHCWKEWFFTHVKNSIPMKVVTDTNSPPWIDGEVRHLLRKMYAALKRFRQSRTNACEQKLRTPSQSVKYLVRQKHR